MYSSFSHSGVKGMKWGVSKEKRLIKNTDLAEIKAKSDLEKTHKVLPRVNDNYGYQRYTVATEVDSYGRPQTRIYDNDSKSWHLVTDDYLNRITEVSELAYNSRKKKERDDKIKSVKNKITSWFKHSDFIEDVIDYYGDVTIDDIRSQF